MNVLILIAVLWPVAAALFTLIIKEQFKNRAFREKYTAVVLVVNVLLVIGCAITRGEAFLVRIADNVDIAFRPDGLSALFIILTSAMWLLSGVFSFEYMKKQERNESYYFFFIITLGMLNAVGMAKNLVTLYMFFEGMALLSMPLVLHSRTKEAIKAATKYLMYSVFGASFGLLTIIFTAVYGTTMDFTAGGVFDAAKVAGHENLILWIVLLGIVGFAAKAGMFPLHSWIPAAYPAAPSSASAVLTGIISKAGVVAVIRMVFYIAGVDMLRGTFVQYAFMSLSLITVFMGSMMAFMEKDFKRRLAYSSVSQVSYVLFGLSTMTVEGFVGALLQMVFHSVVKDGLFLTAGTVIYETGITTVEGLKGLGRRMPLVFAAFSMLSLSLVGMPPFAGFVSKEFLAYGSLDSGAPVLSVLGPCVLLLSAFLTAGYLLPICIKAFMPGDKSVNTEVIKVSKLMVVPIVLLAIAALLFGLCPVFFEHAFEAIAESIMM